MGGPSENVRPPAHAVPIARPITLHMRALEGEDERQASEVSVLAVGWNDLGGFLYLVFDRFAPQAPRWIPQDRVERLFEH